MKTPIVLTKVSLLYSPVEDRIRMTGSISEADTIAFWLTFRICQKLVRAIGDYIEKSTDFPSGADRDLVLSFKQSAAMVRKDASDPVVASGDASVSLIERIDVNLRKEAMLLSFFVPNSVPAQLSLSVQHGRQWLGALRTQYQQAGWPLEAWPVWLAGATDGPKASGVNQRMH